MKTGFPLIALLTAWMLWAAPVAMAGRIGLRIQVLPAVSSNQVAVTTSFRNTGTETAAGVSARITFMGHTVQIAGTTNIPPGETASFSEDLGPTPAPGQYPLIVSARYTDANGYEASAVKALAIATPGNNREIPVTLRLADAHVAPRGEATLFIETESPEPIALRATLVVPGCLSCEQPTRRVSASSRHTANPSFTLTNRHGLSGSRYRIYAIVEGEKDGQPWCAIADARADLPLHRNLLSRHLGRTVLAAGLCLAVFIGLQFRKTPRPGTASVSASPRRHEWLFALGVLAIWVWFFFDHIPLPLLLADTTLAGGDTVAHSYLASHLRQSLLGSARIVSWAPGWWCGFPMFQYYFCLPYVLTVLLDLLLPFNAALKLVTILGILALPPCAFICAKSLRLPGPGALLVAIVAVPFLFDHSHTMWGVNIYSTLAGMISNSISFSLMLLAIASAARDADDGCIRIRSVALFILLASSHFFTSIMAVPVVVLLPLLRPKSGFLSAVRVLATEASIAALSMSWWIIPLLAKRDFAVDFGSNWDVSLTESFPYAALAAMPFAIVAIVACRKTGARFVVLMAWMAATALFLFRFGYGLSPVFVNVRLWPFLTFSIMSLGAAGLGTIIANRRAPMWAVAAVLLCSLSIGIDYPNQVRQWAEWNYSGLEAKPRFSVFKKLVFPLEGTPGRLANDLHGDNNSIGSSRVFESVPHLFGKPILEGGVVNSAAGSLYSYYLQSETSASCAGFPSIVTPTTFNITNATAHLEMFNVKHFIARGDATRAAMEADPRWKFLAREQDWSLFELMTHEGRYVSTCAAPVAVRSDDWKRDSLFWLYDTRRLAKPVIFLRPGQTAPPSVRILSSSEFETWLAAETEASAPPPAHPLQADFSPVEREDASSGTTIRFTTRAVGRPHVIRYTYFPNWKVRGAKAVYMVSPCFMLVYPDREEVELYYGYTFSDNLGRGLSAIGMVCIVAIPAVRSRRRRRSRRKGYIVQSQRASQVS